MTGCNCVSGIRAYSKPGRDEQILAMWRDALFLCCSLRIIPAVINSFSKKVVHNLCWFGRATFFRPMRDSSPGTSICLNGSYALPFDSIYLNNFAFLSGPCLNGPILECAS